MQGGNFQFDPIKKTLEIDAFVMSEHPQSFPALDAAMETLKRVYRPQVEIEQQGSGHWTVKILLAPIEEQDRRRKSSLAEGNRRRAAHKSALEDQAAQLAKAEADRKAKKREEQGLPPQEIEELPDEPSPANPMAEKRGNKALN